MSAISASGDRKHAVTDIRAKAGACVSGHAGAGCFASPAPGYGECDGNAASRKLDRGVIAIRRYALVKFTSAQARAYA
jgi:hypothetical protein